MEGKAKGTRAVNRRILDIKDAILLIRGHKVILDSDLATLYGVETKALTGCYT